MSRHARKTASTFITVRVLPVQPAKLEQSGQHVGSEDDGVLLQHVRVQTKLGGETLRAERLEPIRLLPVRGREPSGHNREDRLLFPTEEEGPKHHGDVVGYEPVNHMSEVCDDRAGEGGLDARLCGHPINDVIRLAH